ncbi:MAG: hypothetical protein ACRECN_06985, partial [Methylocella sp.]
MLFFEALAMLLVRWATGSTFLGRQEEAERDDRKSHHASQEKNIRIGKHGGLDTKVLIGVSYSY